MRLVTLALLAALLPAGAAADGAATYPQDAAGSMTGAGIGATGAIRIKDITSIRGVRDNQLIGYGLVVGLAGTGDSLRNAPFTGQALEAMLDHLGINIGSASIRVRNVAAVMVTAELPPFVGFGSRIDVSVASLGDSSSLRGGTLLLTELQGGDGEVYAVAQGPVSISGFAAEGQAAQLSQGVATAGRIANGALIERELPVGFGDEGPLVLELRNPDFATAVAIADRINAFTRSRYGVAAAREDDLRAVTLLRPAKVSLPRFVAEIGALRVNPDTVARVVIDEKTGTVVIGADVRISPVAVTHGTLTVEITEAPQVSQPRPFSNGETVVVPRTAIEAKEMEAHLSILEGATLETLVRGLNQIGLKPGGIITILQTIKTAGALQAELLVQ